ncbi:MAG: Dps family protein [Akkermansiaceae bacterium]
MKKNNTSNPQIGLDAKDTKKISTILSQILADQHVLYIKTRNYHWNLIGGRFHSLHVHFEEQYTKLAEAIDETAERIRMIGGVAPGSMKEFLGLASLKEDEGSLIEGDAAIQSLLDDNESAIKCLRKSITEIEELNDVGTADFLTGTLQHHEMTAWMLRSYLETKSS